MIDFDDGEISAEELGLFLAISEEMVEESKTPLEEESDLPDDDIFDKED